MKRLLLLSLLAIMILALVVGCGKKAEEDADKMPVEEKAAEMMDTTQMDSAMMEAGEAVEGAVEEATDAAEEVVEEATGE